MTISIGIGIGLTHQRKLNPAFFVLDGLTVSPLYAYSVRKLRAGYAGSCMRVRRSSDNAEADIGFTSSGDLDQVALLDHVAANSGFVTVWYNQMVGVNATQNTAASQTRIVNAGAIDFIGSRPAIKFLGAQYINIATGRTGFSGCYSSLVFRRNSGSGNSFSFRDLGAIGLIDDLGTSGFSTRVRNDANVLQQISGVQTTNQTVGGYNWDSPNATVNLSLNGVYTTAAGPTGTSTIDRAALGASAFAFNLFFTGDQQEYIFFGAPIDTTNRRALELSQGSYFGVTIA